MTTRTWNGSNAPFATAADWNPSGVPTSGDIAVINSGTVSVGPNDLAAGLSLQLTAASAVTEVDLNGTTIQATDNILVNAAAAQAILGVSGAVNNQGVIVLAAVGAFNPIVRLTNAPGGGPSTLTNTGAINLTNSIVQFQNNGGSTNQIVNNGLISMRASAGLNEELFSTLTVAGTGTIQVGPGYRYETTGGVGSGQSIVLESSNGQGSTLAVDNATAFNGQVFGFTASDRVFLTTPQYSSYTASFANGVTTVVLNGSSSSVGQVNLAGNYTTGNLSVDSAIDPNSGFEVTRLSTTVADSNGTSGVTGIYRFFDTIYGTHLFTSDPGEKKTILATRPDLKQETNGFGAVDPAAKDPTAIPVYRFFNNVDGTHFFTASAGERDQVRATRSDLVYEPSSSFLEHGTLQAGDVPVYRLFDNIHGTQFLTGDQNEYNGLITPGSATYRADLIDPHIAFYAPVGSFT